MSTRKRAVDHSRRPEVSRGAKCLPIGQFLVRWRTRSRGVSSRGYHSWVPLDLGARKVCEELDALQVLGVDPVKNLVVPRFLALMVVTGLFDIYALLFGIFGGIIAIICCYKGMAASGGAEGVGRAVNEAVVVTVTAIFAFDYVFTQTLLVTHPQILVIE
jgi:phospholipid/cholesterol/gamma-HCH transport system permease protein